MERGGGGLQQAACGGSEAGSRRAGRLLARLPASLPALCPPRPLASPARPCCASTHQDVARLLHVVQLLQQLLAKLVHNQLRVAAQPAQRPAEGRPGGTAVEGAAKGRRPRAEAVAAAHGRWPGVEHPPCELASGARCPMMTTRRPWPRKTRRVTVCLSRCSATCCAAGCVRPRQHTLPCWPVSAGCPPVVHAAGSPGVDKGA